RADRARLEAGEADGGDGTFDAALILAPDPAEQPFAAPQAHRHHVVDADREGAVDLSDLWQVGDVLRTHAISLNAAGERLDDADHALEQRRFAGPVRTNHRGQRAGPHRTVEMMHRRVT